MRGIRCSEPLASTGPTTRRFPSRIFAATPSSYRLGFRCCIKAPAAVTALTLGPPGGRTERNRDFLSIDRLEADLLQPLAVAFADHAGPIILEFPPFARTLQLEPAAFLDAARSLSRRVAKSNSSTPSSCATGGCSRPNITACS